MRILLDECLPKRLKRDLAWHDARTADRNLSFQQDVDKLNIAVVVMVAKGNKHADLPPLIADVQVVLGALTLGQVVRVGV